MNIGDSIPDFQLKDQNGDLFNSSSLENIASIIFFYPKDFTPGCTAQVCEFRDSMEIFVDEGISVVGISADSTHSHGKFAKKYQLNFPLLSDPDKELRKKFGVKPAFLGLLPGRETFVFNSEGTLVHKFRSINAKEHVPDVMKKLDLLK